MPLCGGRLRWPRSLLRLHVYESSGQIRSRLFVLLNELVDEEEGGGRSGEVPSRPCAWRWGTKAGRDQQLMEGRAEICTSPSRRMSSPITTVCLQLICWSK